LGVQYAREEKMFGKMEELALVLARERSEPRCLERGKVDEWCRNEYRESEHDG